MSEKQLSVIDGGRDVEPFEPDRHRLRVAALDYSIDQAKRIKDWPALEQAVDAKIEEQHKFVAWWDANVALGKGGDRKTNAATTALIPWRKAEDLTGMKHQRKHDLEKRLQAPDRYRQRLLGVAYVAAFLEAGENVRGTQGTGENEWFTPLEYIERARAVLGEIDLDPATHILAQQVVRAKKYITKDQFDGLGGLGCEWLGNVWLNPPYAQPLIALFAAKMVEEWKANRVTAAIMLTHNYTDTAWFHQIANSADAMCFTRGRVKFYEPDGAIAAPTQGQAFFYFGPLVKAFVQQFNPVGFVVVPWR